MKKLSIATAVGVSALALVLSGCTGTTAPTTAPDPDPESLVLMLTPSDEPAKLQPLGDTIAAYLTKELGIPVTAKVPTDYAAVISALGAGQADIAFTAPALTVQAVDSGVADAILMTIRNGSRSYVTQWFTNDPDTYCMTPVVTGIVKAGDVEVKYCNGADTAEYGDPVGVDALKKVKSDTVIAFVNTSSVSGYQAPVAQLISLGVVASPEELTNVINSGGHPNAVLNVARGEGGAVIGTSYDDARASAWREEPKVQTDVVVFAWSDPIPNDGVVAASDLSDDLQKRIADAFKKMVTADPAAAAAVLEAYTVDGFADPDLAALDTIRLLQKIFQ